jgi:ABC-type polysaccharide/polyol phosphate transport system ATPase subunit
MWNVKNKSVANNNRGKWNHLKIIQTITEPHTGKVRNKGTTENSRIAYCTLTSVSANVKVLNI